MAACCLANKGGVEICTLDKNIGGCVLDTGVKTAEHTGNTHRLTCIANHQVTGVKSAFHSVKSSELSALRACAHNNLFALYLSQIKAVKRLTDTVQYKIGDIYNIINGTLTDNRQVITQPFGTLSNLNTTDSDAAVAGAGFTVCHFYRNSSCGGADLEINRLRLFHCRRIGMTAQPCAQITCHSVMARRIHPVGCQINLQKVVTGESVKFSRRNTGLNRRIQDDNAVM